MNTITLELNGKTIVADEITFAKRLEYDKDLVHEGTDGDWEIFSINGGNYYVAYQQAGCEGTTLADVYGI